MDDALAGIIGSSVCGKSLCICCLYLNYKNARGPVAYLRLTKQFYDEDHNKGFRLANCLSREQVFKELEGIEEISTTDLTSEDFYLCVVVQISTCAWLCSWSVILPRLT